MIFKAQGVIRREGKYRLCREFLWRPKTLQGVCRWLEWADFWEISRVETYERFLDGNSHLFATETVQRTIWEGAHWHFVRIEGDE